jgi:hypothetical protein
MIEAARVLGRSCSLNAKSVTGHYLMFGCDKRSADVHVTLLVVPLLSFRTSLARLKDRHHAAGLGAESFEGLHVAFVFR